MPLESVHHTFLPERNYPDNWTNSNRQPGINPNDEWYGFKTLTKGLPVCPHYDLILICARLARVDITQTPDFHFCGIATKHDITSRHPFFSLPDIYAEVVTTCGIVHDQLSAQVKQSEVKTELNTKTMEQILAESSHPIAKRNALNDWIEQEQEIRNRDLILQNWRTVIFETSCLPNSSIEIPHFRRLSPEDLEEQEVRAKVCSFLISLKNLATGFTYLTTRLSRGSECCPQAPKIRSSGIHFID